MNDTSIHSQNLVAARLIDTAKCFDSFLRDRFVGKALLVFADDAASSIDNGTKLELSFDDGASYDVVVEEVPVIRLPQPYTRAAFISFDLRTLQGRAFRDDLRVRVLGGQAT